MNNTNNLNTTTTNSNNFLSSFHNKKNNNGNNNNNTATMIKYSDKSNHQNPNGSLTIGTKFPVLIDRLKQPGILTQDVVTAVAPATATTISFKQPLSGSNSNNSSSSGCDVMDSTASPYTSSPCSVSSMVSSEFTSPSANSTSRSSATPYAHIRQHQPQHVYTPINGCHTLKVMGNSNPSTSLVKYKNRMSVGGGNESPLPPLPPQQNEAPLALRSSVV
jgi:hypothetical protein